MVQCVDVPCVFGALCALDAICLMQSVCLVFFLVDDYDNCCNLESRSLG